MSTPHWMPNFFIVGVPKAGTSSLHTWLAAHPDAFGSKDKETCFFADPDTHIYRKDFNVSQGLGAYAQQFTVPEHASPQVIFESTPAYIYQNTALNEIPALASTPRCLFILREPAAQIASVHRYYQNNWSMIPADMDLTAYVRVLHDKANDFSGNELAREALTNAKYLPYLRRWQQALGPGRMKVMTFEAMKQDNRAFMREISVWLGLDPSFYDTYDFPHENESYQPRSRALQRINIALRGLLPKRLFYEQLRRLYRRANTTAPDVMSDADRDTLARLRQEFTDDNARLADEFHLDLSAWTR